MIYMAHMYINVKFGTWRYSLRIRWYIIIEVIICIKYCKCMCMFVTESRKLKPQIKAESRFKLNYYPQIFSQLSIVKFQYIISSLLYYNSYMIGWQLTPDFMVSKQSILCIETLLVDLNSGYSTCQQMYRYIYSIKVSIKF